jgi:hypothetical protein
MGKVEAREGRLMGGVLQGFAVIGVIIGVGIVLGRTGVLGDEAGPVLTRLAFFVATPALLLVTLARADLRQVFSPSLAVSAVSALTVGAAFYVVSRRVFGRTSGTAVIGAWASSYVNAGNLGLPMATYVLGNTTAMASVILFQLSVMAPLGLIILDSTGSEPASPARLALRTAGNPVILACVTGILLSLLHITLPAALFNPLSLLADLSVPGILLAFGLSLSQGAAMPEAGTRAELATIVLFKLLLQPLVAGLLAIWVFGASGRELLTVTLVAALPTAQNIFTYASRYGHGQTLARNSALATTVLSVPTIVCIAAFLR